MGKMIIIDSPIQWGDLLDKFPNLDCYYSYEYGDLFSRIENGKLLAAYYEDFNCKIFYPFIKREVPNVVTKVYDIVTPYGYGGPIVNGSNESIHKFYDLFRSYCRDSNIITETIRFHPLYRNNELFENQMEVKYIRKTTGVDLTLPLNDIRKNYTKMNNRNIKKAINNHLTCMVVDNTQENINIFMDLYRETMDRNGASDYYYFDESYFEEQLKDTGTSNTFLLFTKLEAEVIAGVMVLVGKEFSHYHLGASKTNYLDLKPNNLLFDFMVEFCKSKGSRILHLGGGYQEDDGLFKFKTSFTNDNNYEYYIGRKVHNELQYLAIIEELQKQYQIVENYFPIYRGKLRKLIV